jgi:hypothetical protein
MNYTACLVLIGVAERARSKCHTTRVSAAADWQFARTALERAVDTFLLLPVSPLHVRSANTQRERERKSSSFCAKVTDKNFLYISTTGIVSLALPRVQQMA